MYFLKNNPSGLNFVGIFFQNFEKNILEISMDFFQKIHGDFLPDLEYLYEKILKKKSLEISMDFFFKIHGISYRT